MTRHIIVEIILLIFCAVTVVAAYACCVVAGRCSRIEEKSSYPRKVNKPFRSVWIDDEYKEIGEEKCQENTVQK